MSKFVSPLIFHPIFKERVWGGRELERRFGKPLPPNLPIGESWEVSDRADDQSIVAHGPLAGKSLHWLMANHRPQLLGLASDLNGRFPLLVKILDAQETLSLQVHPPARLAQRWAGEPKTEMWYVVEAAPEAELFVGLKRGTTRELFEEKLRQGSVADCFHRVRVRAGDAMFVPSGRVHAIGRGCLLFEIQQNSDTTYRVFDWNRAGLEGRPRELHIAQSLESIDFSDIEPPLIQAPVPGPASRKTRALVRHPLFEVDLLEMEGGQRWRLSPDRCAILGMVSGELSVCFHKPFLHLRAGQFALVPASAAAGTQIETLRPAKFLLAFPGQAS